MAISSVQRWVVTAFSGFSGIPAGGQEMGLPSVHWPSGGGWGLGVLEGPLAGGDV